MEPLTLDAEAPTTTNETAEPSPEELQELFDRTINLALEGSVIEYTAVSILNNKVFWDNLDITELKKETMGYE